jgi:hypothetical protein
VLEPDDSGAVQQRVKQRDPDGVRFGAGGSGAGEPGLAARQFVVGGDPALARVAVESDGLLGGGEARGEADLLADAIKIVSIEPSAEGQRLRALDSQTIKRLKKPFASSVAVMWRSSSCLVMCPTMPMCAPVARSGLFLAIVCNVLPSQALRITGESVLPSRASTFITCANSDSTTSLRFSATCNWPSLASATSAISPSPELIPEAMQRSTKPPSTSRISAST